MSAEEFKLFLPSPPAVGPTVGEITSNSDKSRSMARQSSCNAERFEISDSVFFLEEEDDEDDDDAEGLLPFGAIDEEAAERITLSRREEMSMSLARDARWEEFRRDGRDPPSLSSSSAIRDSIVGSAIDSSTSRDDFDSVMLKLKC